MSQVQEKIKSKDRSEKQQYWDYCAEGGEFSFEQWKARIEELKIEENESLIMIKQVKGRFITENPRAYLLLLIVKLVNSDSKSDRLTYGDMALEAFEEHERQLKEGQI